MARQNRMNKKLVQFKFRHSSLCTFGYLRTRPVKCLSRDNLSWWSYAQINEYYLTHWAVPTVEQERNRMIGNKKFLQISVRIHIILTSGSPAVMIQQNHLPWWTWKRTRLGRIITNVRNRTCVLHLSDFQGIKSLKWSLEDAKAFVRFTLTNAPFIAICSRQESLCISQFP